MPSTASAEAPLSTDTERFHCFAELLSRRWADACYVAQLPPNWVKWDIGDYPHFRKPRGYGVTFQFKKNGPCHLRFAKKILYAPLDRADGVIRHEIGHVLDVMLPPQELDYWASQRGVLLPKTQERRADAIAYVIWREPIRYDPDLLVQSTTRGVTLRPEHLGL